MSTPGALCVDETVLAEVNRWISLHKHFGTGVSPGCSGQSLMEAGNNTKKGKVPQEGWLDSVAKIPAGKVLWEVRTSF